VSSSTNQVQVQIYIRGYMLFSLKRKV
jgi:hypothetical protein